MPDVAEPMTEHATDPKKKKRNLTHPRDPAREVVETIVFVVVLVLLLKLFVTEAFVIPTGSMAETLYGYQKIITCPKCGHEFPVNAHDEAEGDQQSGRKEPLYGFCCPNCRYLGHVKDLNPLPGPPNTGDRVLVLKPLFHARRPERGEVVVFKWPEKPQDKHVAQNYIKRAMAFGGETVAIYRGELFVTRALEYPADALGENGQPLYPRPGDPDDLWEPKYAYPNHHIPGHDVVAKNPLADERFELSRTAGFRSDSNGGFGIIRKGEEQVLADMRVVWDNDQQPKELAGKVPKRWYPEARPGAKPGEVLPWNGNDEQQPTAFRHDKPELDWLRYRHLAMPWKTDRPDQADDVPQTDFAALAAQSPTYIDNFLGYNAGRDLDPTTGRTQVRETGQEKLWVGDLILECKATFDAGSKVILELSRGINRFQAEFEQGKVTLRRLGAGGEEFKEPTRPCKVGAGAHELRFANVDCRLWVWVDGKLVDFGTDGDYAPPTPEQETAFKDQEVPSNSEMKDLRAQGATMTNDVLAPASIGASGGVGIQNIKLRRDIYYTQQGGSGDYTKADIFYVQPGHTMCLGDNSAQSSDSRKWGMVPDRLMLGKAVFVFWPGPFFGHPNRIGFIK